MAKIKIDGIVKEGTQIGIKNLLPVCVNYLLFILTCWIPYLNIGTFIGIITLPAKMSKDETLSFTEIFNPVYRKYMGEGFLAMGLMFSGLTLGFMLLVIPGIVIAIAWSLTLLLVFDKKMDPISAIKKSNDLTYGNKLMILVGKAIYFILMGIVIKILQIVIPSQTPVIISLILILVFMIVCFSLLAGVDAYIYRELAE